MLKNIPNIIQTMMAKILPKMTQNFGTNNGYQICPQMKSSCHLPLNQKWAAAAPPPTFGLSINVPALFICGHIWYPFFVSLVVSFLV